MRLFVTVFLFLGVWGVALAKSTPLWFVFLVKGDHQPDADKAQSMQDAHIGNFKRLFLEHKLVAAGPLQDPSNFRRGIVILTVPSLEAVRQCFNTDPYVQAGVMHLEVYRWNADRKRIHLHSIDLTSIEENRIVLLFKGDSWPTKGKWPNVARHEGGSIGGTFKGPGEIKEVRLFAGTASESKVKSALESDASIKSGKVKYAVIPLWVAKGTLGK